MRFSQHFYQSDSAVGLQATAVLPALVVSATLSVQGGPIMTSDSWVVSPLDLSEENTSPFVLNPIDMTPLDMEN